MKNTTTLFLKLFFIPVFCICFSQIGKTQTATSPDTLLAAPNQPLQYFKIEIGMHILDCPVLPPQLKEKLMTLKGIKNYQVDRNAETIVFSVPEGVATKEMIVNMALKSGFPASAVNVLVNDKPFAN